MCAKTLWGKEKTLTLARILNKGFTVKEEFNGVMQSFLHSANIY